MKAWSDLESDGSGNRGWPSCVTFYQNRLFFAGSKDLPQSMWGSKSGDFGNFEAGTGQDDDAFGYVLASDTINDIKYMISGQALQLFTYSSEWAIPQSYDQSLTPSTLQVRKQSQKGVTDVKPIIVDDVTFFVKKGGHGVEAFVYNSDNFTYDSENVSIFSTDLIEDPVSGCALDSSTNDDAHWLILVNSDGSLAIYQTLREQEVSAWSLATSQTIDDENVVYQSYFKQAVTVDNTVYFVVERTIDGATVRYLEKHSFDVYTDCTIRSTYGTPTDTITGLNKLNNMTVGFVGDSYAFSNKVVTSNQIVLVPEFPDEDVTISSADVGCLFTPLVETNPIVPLFDVDRDWETKQFD